MSNTGVKKGKTYRLALLGILSAIIILQNFVPFLGYIPIQPFNPTIIHITVIIAAVVAGPFEGAVLGGVWGVVCLFRAFFYPTSPIDPIVFTNPMVSVFPRILVGLFAGYTVRLLKKADILLSATVAGIVGSFTNSIFVLGFIYLFHKTSYANYYNMDVSQLFPAMVGVLASNGVAEAIAAAILTPLICIPLNKYLGKNLSK